jgi:polar amino acid transport system substrate-binding protein
MRHFKKTSACVLAVIAAATLGACSSGSSPSGGDASQGFHLINPGYLTVATHGTEPPELSISLGGKLGALDGSWITEFAKEHHLKIKLFQTTFASAILAVQDGKADVGVAAYYSPTRAKVVYFTYPFFEDHAAVLALPSFKYTGPSSLKGKQVGTVTGFVWQPYLQKVFGSNLHIYPDTATVGKALLDGSISAYFDTVTSNVFSPPLTTQNSKTYLIKNGQFGMPESVLIDIARNYVNCKNSKLAAAMNATMAKMHKNGSWATLLKANQLTALSNPALTTEPNHCG